MTRDEQIEKFFTEDVSLDLNSINFNFVKNSVFQDIVDIVPKKNFQNDLILSVYFLNVDKEKVLQTNSKLDQHKELIFNKLIDLKIRNPVLLVNGA